MKISKNGGKDINKARNCKLKGLNDNKNSCMWSKILHVTLQWLITSKTMEICILMKIS